MAKSWLEKLNVLVHATINDFAGDIGSRLPVPPNQVSPALSQEVEELRKKVNDALIYEEQLESEIQKLADQIAQLDQTADEAIAGGDEARARRLIQKRRRLENDMAIRQADLDQHRRATAELISNVNYFESLVGDLSRQDSASEPEKPTPHREPAPTDLTGAESRLSGGPTPTTTGEPTKPTKRVRIRVVKGEHPDEPTAEVIAETPPPPEAAKTTSAEPAAAPDEPKRYRIPGTGAVAKPEPPPQPEVKPEETESIPETQKPDKPKRYRIPDTGAVVKPKATKSPKPEPSAEARLSAPSQPTPKPEPRVAEPVSPPADTVEKPEDEERPTLPEVERLTEALRKARRSVEEAEEKFAETDAIRVRVEQAAGEPLPEITGVYEPSPDEIDAEIVERRKRLGKKKKKDDEDE